MGITTIEGEFIIVCRPSLALLRAIEFRAEFSSIEGTFTNNELTLAAAGANGFATAQRMMALGPDSYSFLEWVSKQEVYSQQQPLSFSIPQPHVKSSI